MGVFVAVNMPFVDALVVLTIFPYHLSSLVTCTKVTFKIKHYDVYVVV